MRTFISVLILLLSAACNSRVKPAAAESPKTTPTSDTLPKAEAEEVSESAETARYYLVIADTGKDYTVLRNQMYRMSRAMGSAIDTMGRYYNTQLHKIILPEDDEDEVYAGTYYPRRFASSELSIEYLSYYLPGADTNTMALVAAIAAFPSGADSLAKIYRKESARTFVLPADIYVGCMH